MDSVFPRADCLRASIKTLWRNGESTQDQHRREMAPNASSGSICCKINAVSSMRTFTGLFSVTSDAAMTSRYHWLKFSDLGVILREA